MPNQPNLIDDAISTYVPAGEVFGMENWKPLRFRVNRPKSYINDYGKIQIVLDVERDGVWLEFGKAEPEEIHFYAFPLREEAPQPKPASPKEKPMERFYVLKVNEPIPAKKPEANWLVKQHLDEYQSEGSKVTYFVLEGRSQPFVVSSYGEYDRAEYAPGTQITLMDDGNRTTSFGRSFGKQFRVKAVITPAELPTVVQSGRMNFYVCK
jgi:hypothetical protein